NGERYGAKQEISFFLIIATADPIDRSHSSMRFVLFEADDLTAHLRFAGQTAQKGVWKARSTALDLRESRIPHADIFLAQELGRSAVLNAQVAVSKQKKFDGFIRERDATQLLRFRLLNELPQRLTIQFDQLLGRESICGPELLEFVRRKPVRRLALGDILYG